MAGINLRRSLRLTDSLEVSLTAKLRYISLQYDAMLAEREVAQGNKTAACANVTANTLLSFDPKTTA